MVIVLLKYRRLFLFLNIITSITSDIKAVFLTSHVNLRYVDGFKYDPHGRLISGDVSVKIPHVFKGYYRDETLTKEVLDDRHFTTCDIGTIAINGSFQIIDCCTWKKAN